MSEAVNVYNAFVSMSSAHNVVEWGRANPEAEKIVLEVRAMRKEDGEHS